MDNICDHLRLRQDIGLGRRGAENATGEVDAVVIGRVGAVQG